MVFNSPDPKPFQDALRKTDFYPEMKKKSGEEAWALLEKYVGDLRLEHRPSSLAVATARRRGSAQPANQKRKCR